MTANVEAGGYFRVEPMFCRGRQLNEIKPLDRVETALHFGLGPAGRRVI